MRRPLPAPAEDGKTLNLAWEPVWMGGHGVGAEQFAQSLRKNYPWPVRIRHRFYPMEKSWVVEVLYSPHLRKK